MNLEIYPASLSLVLALTHQCLHDPPNGLLVFRPDLFTNIRPDKSRAL